jgi:hypothetical protein
MTGMGTNTTPIARKLHGFAASEKLSTTICVRALSHLPEVMTETVEESVATGIVPVRQRHATPRSAWGCPTQSVSGSVCALDVEIG